LRFIEYCWVAWLLYWVIMAITAKPTIERKGAVRYRLGVLILIFGWIIIKPLSHPSSQSHLWHTTLAVGVLTDCIVVAGAAFTVWARITLGRNWSADVAFKQDHELIESGPYALARHPIYAGLLVMALGTAINYAQAVGFALFLLLCGGAWWKARQEEQIMSKHFPGAYAEYKTRVRAIIPFVL
jgi:protein-S-isoprenylcysteine O-methyltransferase Ste14